MIRPNKPAIMAARVLRAMRSFRWYLKRDQHDAVGDVEIGVAGGQATLLEDDSTGHGKFGDVQGLAYLISGALQTAEIVLERFVVYVFAIGFDLVPRALDLEVRKNHLLRGVEVPMVVRRRLVIPRKAAAVGVQRDDRGGIQAVELGRTELTQVIRSRIRRAEIHQLQFRIVGKAVPGRAAALILRVAMRVPGLCRRRKLRIFERLPDGRRHRVKPPFEGAVHQVIGRHVAAHTPAPHVRSAVSNDDEVAGDLRCAGAGIGQLVIDDGIGFPDLGAGRGIERVQTSVDRSDVHLALPHRHAAVDEIAARISGGKIIRLGIVAPQFAAGRGVKRIDVSPGAGGVHHAVDDDRGRLLAAHRSSEIVLPGESQAVEVLRIQHRQRRVVGSVLVASARVPVLGRGVRCPQPRRIERSRRAMRRALPRRVPLRRARRGQAGRAAHERRRQATRAAPRANGLVDGKLRLPEGRPKA